MYLWKGWSWSLTTILTGSAFSTAAYHHNQTNSQQINIDNFIKNLKEVSELAKEDTNILFRETKNNINNVEVLNNRFDFYTHKIDSLDKEINANFKTFFEDEHVARQSKYDVSSHLIELLVQRIDVLNQLIVELKGSKKPELAIKIQTKVEKLNETLADLNSKKMSLDLENIVNWSAFNRHLDHLITDTNNQFEILKNVNHGNMQRVEKFRDLNDQIHNQDQQLKTIILQYLQPKGQSWFNKSMLKHAKLIYDKASQNHHQRIKILQKMTSFLTSSSIFGQKDGAILQGLVTQTTSFLKENLVEYDKLFKKIQDDVDKVIDEDQDQNDLKIVNKVAQSFRNNQQFRNNKVLIYQNGQIWKVGDKISFHDLEIEEPAIEELSLVKIDYEITEISTENSNRYVKVKALITKNKASKGISIVITNFTTKEDLQYEWLNRMLEYVNDKNETRHKDDYVSAAYGDDTGEGLGIHNSLSDHMYSIHGIESLKYEVIKRDYIKGFVQAKVTISREGKTASKIIQVSGFKSIKPEIDRFHDALKHYDQYNPMSLDFKISLSNTWKDVIKQFKDRLKNNFSSSFINAIVWKSGDFDSLDTKINKINQKDGTISKSVVLEIYGYKLPKITLYFNQIFNQHTTIDIELEGSMGNNRTGPTWDRTHEEKTFVLIEKFHEKFHSWYDFSRRYQKMSLKNFTFTVHSAMNTNSHINTAKVGTNGSQDVFELNEESVGRNPFPIYHRGYNDYTSQQELGIFFELHVNDQDQLTIKFVLDGYSRSTDSSIYLYLSFGTIEFS